MCNHGGIETVLFPGRKEPPLPTKATASAKPKRTLKPWKAFQVRQRNLDEKRHAVLQTAAHLFLENGYRNTSMSELAKRLSITKPALYYYFKNKEDILVECYREGIADIEGSLDQAAVSHGNGLSKIRAYIEAYARAIAVLEFGRCVAMLDDSELSLKARKQVRELKRSMDLSMRKFVEEGIADGSITPCNPKIAAFAIAGAVNWIGIWYKVDGEVAPEEIAREFARLLTDGLRVLPAAAKPAAKSTRKKALVAEAEPEAAH